MGAQLGSEFAWLDAGGFFVVCPWFVKAQKSNRTTFWKLVRITIGKAFLFTSAQVVFVPKKFATLKPPDAYYPLNENGSAYDRVWQNIAQIDEMARKNDVPLKVIVFPTAFQLNSAGHPDVPQQVLANRASLAGIEIIDLLPAYSQVCDEAEVDACEGYENLLFADVWMHPNELGYRIATKQLEKSIAVQLLAVNEPFFL